MNRSKIYLAVGAMLMATFVVGVATPVAANPDGTEFTWTTLNFQGNVGGEKIPFGVETLSASGMLIDSHSTPLPNGDEFIDIWFTTENGEYLANSVLAESEFLISGLNWGPGAPRARAVGLVYYSFDVDGVFSDLNPDNGSFPILPHPLNGEDALVFDIDGAPVDSLSFDIDFTLGFILDAILVNNSPTDIRAVNSMHVGFQIHHIPEPVSMMLVVTGLVGLCMVRCRKRS